MKAIYIDTKETKNRANTLVNISNRFNDIVNSSITDPNYSNTINIIKHSYKYINSIKDGFSSNINYLNKAYSYMEELDNKYARLEPTDFSSSLDDYKKRWIDRGLDVDGKIFELADSDTGITGNLISSSLSFIKESYELIKEKKYENPLDSTKYFLKVSKLAMGLGSASEGIVKTLGEIASKGADVVKKWEAPKFELGFDKWSAFKELGYVAGIGINVINNYKEYGEFSKRAIAETVCESAIGIGKKLAFKALGKGIGWAVGGLVTMVAGPVVGYAVGKVVGEIAGPALEFAADWVCEKYTGENLTEYLSDSALNYIDKEYDSIDLGPDSKRAGEYSS